MDANDFREFGKAAIDAIVEYTENVGSSAGVLPDVQPGYLHKLLPTHVPEQGEHWTDILKDFHTAILPGVTHWQSPHFHAYYPTSTSYPSVVGEMLSSGLGIIGFSWITSPACTELEVVVMDWLGKLLGLPEHFLNCSEGPGGGVIQGSASEATFLCLLAAKERTLRRQLKDNPAGVEGEIKSRLVAYTSDQANSSVEKAGLLSSVPIRLLPSDDQGRLTGPVVRDAMLKDMEKGLIPSFVCATLGTTATCAFDMVEDISTICKEFGVWLHVDAAYAGSACVCPEYRHMLQGVESADSFNFNPHKWLLVNFDCSALWVQDAGWLVDAFNVDRVYLQHHKQGDPWAPDYRHWQIPLGRRFRALKLWITLRTYGVSGLQHHIRSQVSLAQQFAALVKADERFQVITSQLGLVCFRMRGSCELNKKLLSALVAHRKIYLIAGRFRGELCLRFVVCSRLTTSEDVKYAWHEIQSQAGDVAAKYVEKEHHGKEQLFD